MTNRIYSSYREALEASNNGEGYSGELLVRVVSAKTTRFVERLKFEKQLELSALRTVLFLAILSEFRKDILLVLDFGGACGYHYHVCKALLPKQRFDWRIVETGAMVKQAKMFHENEELSFYDSTELAGKNSWIPDAIIASSAIQYCPAPLETLDILLNLNATLFFLTRTPLSTHDQPVVSLQTSRLSHNGPGELPTSFSDMAVQYPITYVPRSKVLGLALSREYDLRFSLNEEPATLLLNGVGLNRHESLLWAKGAR
jgi:putative methyltransferase (TIGR04325 family)